MTALGMTIVILYILYIYEAAILYIQVIQMGRIVNDHRNDPAMAGGEGKRH